MLECTKTYHKFYLNCLVEMLRYLQKFISDISNLFWRTVNSLTKRSIYECEERRPFECKRKPLTPSTQNIRTTYVLCNITISTSESKKKQFEVEWKSASQLIEPLSNTTNYPKINMPTMILISSVIRFSPGDCFSKL